MAGKSASKSHRITATAVAVTIRNAVPAGVDEGNGGHSIGLQATRAQLQARVPADAAAWGPGAKGTSSVARMRLPLG